MMLKRLKRVLQTPPKQILFPPDPFAPPKPKSRIRKVKQATRKSGILTNRDYNLSYTEMPNGGHQMSHETMVAALLMDIRDQMNKLNETLAKVEQKL